MRFFSERAVLRIEARVVSNFTMLAVLPKTPQALLSTQKDGISRAAMPKAGTAYS
jgi:hypothetical protein